LLAPMGIDENNWPATVGMITGIFAKEAVVGTLDALYSALGEGETAGGDAGASAPTVLEGIQEAFATIPTNLVALADAVTDPLGLSITAATDLDEAANEQKVQLGTFGAMAQRFDGQIGAFAYLLAVLLYMPCVAATAAIWRETGTGWAVFASLWTTGLGYGAAVVAYQAGTFARDPGSSATWIGGVLAVFALFLAGFRLYGERDQVQPATAAAAE
jgi:ferrous iron transport protein B